MSDDLLAANVDRLSYVLLMEMQPALIANIRDLLAAGESPEVIEAATRRAVAKLGEGEIVAELVRGAAEHMRREG